jgi:transcriptional regulator with XRE-family HTH domain
MATRELTKPRTASSGCPVVDDARFHRVASVREQQGLSLRSAARQMGVEIREVRRQEQETTDLNLSELYRWQQILGVPIGELLDDNGSPLSRPVMERAHLVRIMKTAKTLKEKAETDDEVDPASIAIARLAETLINQLVEIMPELAEVTPWHAVGQRRSLLEYGKAAERMISEEMFQRTDCM